MKYKKILSLGLAVLLGTTMPTAIYASEDIVVEVESGDFEEDEDIIGEESTQQGILNEEDEVDWTMEDNSDEIDSASDIDIYSDFTSENVATEEVGAEEVTPVFSGFTNASRVSSGNSKTEITKGADATLTLLVNCMASILLLSH